MLTLIAEDDDHEGDAIYENYSTPVMARRKDNVRHVQGHLKIQNE